MDKDTARLVRWALIRMGVIFLIGLAFLFWVGSSGV